MTNNMHQPYLQHNHAPYNISFCRCNQASSLTDWHRLLWCWTGCCLVTPAEGSVVRCMVVTGLQAEQQLPQPVNFNQMVTTTHEGAQGLTATTAKQSRMQAAQGGSTEVAAAGMTHLAASVGCGCVCCVHVCCSCGASCAAAAALAHPEAIYGCLRGEVSIAADRACTDQRDAHDRKEKTTPFGVNDAHDTAWRVGQDAYFCMVPGHSCSAECLGLW